MKWSHQQYGRVAAECAIANATAVNATDLQFGPAQCTEPQQVNRTEPQQVNLIGYDARALLDILCVVVLLPPLQYPSFSGSSLGSSIDSLSNLSIRLLKRNSSRSVWLRYWYITESYHIIYW